MGPITFFSPSVSPTTYSVLLIWEITKFDEQVFLQEGNSRYCQPCGEWAMTVVGSIEGSMGGAKLGLLVISNRAPRRLFIPSRRIDMAVSFSRGVLIGELGGREAGLGSRSKAGRSRRE